MNRRKALQAAGVAAASAVVGGLSLARLQPVPVPMRRRVPVVYADRPAIAGHVFPAAVLAAESKRFGPRPVSNQHEYPPLSPGTIIGTADGWEFDGSVLWADVTLTDRRVAESLAAGEIVIRGVYALRYGPDRVVTGIEALSHLQPVATADASWAGAS